FPTFEYVFASGPVDQNIAVELQQMWLKNLGIHMELRQLEWKVYLNAQSELDYDVSRSSWIGDYDDANTFLGMFTSDNGNNRTGWKDKHYDQLIQEANQQVDLTKREKLFQQAETILVCDDAPIAPLYFYMGVNYFDANRIQGLYENILDQHPLQYIRKTGRESKIESRIQKMDSARQQLAATLR
ncbi:MAG TPA: ABC transporter substrate-binding protein, partial [Verrucomicrobiae bacterium]|nr:ABC transporter substrate-binding protein [Verrucomicrobiae bacterium]